MYNYMVNQLQNFKLQMQLQEVSGSNLSLSKDTSRKNFVSSDLAPYLSAGLDPGLGIT